MYGKVKVPATYFYLIGCFLLYTFLNSPNILVAIPVMLYPLFIYQLFWVVGESNVIFWGLLFQWLSVSTQLIYCIILGISLQEYMQESSFPAELMEFTQYLSIFALYSFSLGLFWAIKNLKIQPLSQALVNYDAKKVLRVYLIVEVVIDASQGIIWNFPAVVQYFYFLFYIKWGFFLVFFYVANKEGGNYPKILIAIILFQFVLGLSSYFSSSFANILMYSFMGFASSNKKISRGTSVLLVIFVVIIFNIGVLWTVAKGDYRTYLTQGEAIQTSTISEGEARNKLFELLSNVDAASYSRGLEALIDRIGYIQYFAAAVRYVPATVPHENGAVYLSAIQHYLVPRFLNPNKAVLDDSKHTNQYTGLGVSDASKGVSFSLGSVADAYVDFGPVYMVVPVFMFGYLCGWFFAFFCRNSPNSLWAWIFTAPFFLLVNIYGADTKKALGFILIYSLTVMALRKQLINRLDPLMRA